MNFIIFLLFSPTFVTAFSNTENFNFIKNFVPSLDVQPLDHFASKGNWSNPAERIAGSNVVQSSSADYPWLAFLWYVIPNVAAGPVSNLIMVTKYFALTTVSSLLDIPIDPTLQLIAILNTDTQADLSSAILRAVREIRVHEDFQGSPLYNLALLRVCPSVPESNVALRPSLSDQYAAGDSAVLVAYNPDILNGEKLIGEYCECDKYQDWTIDQHICVESDLGVYSDLNMVDYGMGPVMIDDKVVGMIHLSQNDIHNYGEYAVNLAKFDDWINTNSFYDEAM